MYNLRNRQVPRNAQNKRRRGGDDANKDHQEKCSTIDAPTCGICLEPINMNIARTEPCGHLFDDACALTWNKVSTRCAVCRAVVNTFKVSCNLNFYGIYWFVVDRFFALVQRSSGHVLSVGSVEDDSTLIRPTVGIEHSTHLMDKSTVEDKLITYSCHGRDESAYFIKDSSGTMFEIPRVITT